MKTWTLAAAFAVIVTGCGGEEKVTQPSNNNSVKSSVASSSNATAEKVAQESRGKLKCPPMIATPPSAEGAPVDDILGVRPGLTYEEAANLVMCSHELMVVTDDKRTRFNIPTYGQPVRQGFHGRFAKERVQKSGQEIMQEMQAKHMARANNAVVRDVAPGESKWFVGTMGTPGDERVTDVAREEWFAEGRQPTVASVEKALTDKYGTPTNRFESNGPQFIWAYDTFGRHITESSPLFNSCNANAYVDTSVNFSPDCGVVVAALVMPMRDNPAIAQSMTVMSVNQAEGNERITSTEQALLAQENARRTKQTEEAAKNADAPQL